ncbi:MAG: rhodanese-like domain-containing protein [Bacteroidota bacterium]|jgi:phage shock protein E
MKELIDNGAFLVDVRTPAEFAEGNVNVSVNIPLDKIVENIESFKDKNNVIVFCRSGNRSAQAKLILEQLGIKNVTNGGTWQDVLACLN